MEEPLSISSLSFHNDSNDDDDDNDERHGRNIPQFISFQKNQMMMESLLTHGLTTHNNNNSPAQQQPQSQQMQQQQQPSQQPLMHHQQQQHQGKEKRKRCQGKHFHCYLLRSLDPRHPSKTYIGFTVDPHRRLRQHNGFLKNGGAYQTKKGRPWALVVVIYGFINARQALQLEWAWQHPYKSDILRQSIHACIGPSMNQTTTATATVTNDSSNNNHYNVNVEDIHESIRKNRRGVGSKLDVLAILLAICHPFRYYQLNLYFLERRWLNLFQTSLLRRGKPMIRRRRTKFPASGGRRLMIGDHHDHNQNPWILGDNITCHHVFSIEEMPFWLAKMSSRPSRKNTTEEHEERSEGEILGDDDEDRFDDNIHHHNDHLSVDHSLDHSIETDVAAVPNLHRATTDMDDASMICVGESGPLQEHRHPSTCDSSDDDDVVVVTNINQRGNPVADVSNIRRNHHSVKSNNNSTHNDCNNQFDRIVACVSVSPSSVSDHNGNANDNNPTSPHHQRNSNNILPCRSDHAQKKHMLIGKSSQNAPFNENSRRNHFSFSGDETPTSDDDDDENDAVPGALSFEDIIISDSNDPTTMSKTKPSHDKYSIGSLDDDDDDDISISVDSKDMEDKPEIICLLDGDSDQDQDPGRMLDDVLLVTRKTGCDRARNDDDTSQPNSQAVLSDKSFVRQQPIVSVCNGVQIIELMEEDS